MNVSPGTWAYILQKVHLGMCKIFEFIASCLRIHICLSYILNKTVAYKRFSFNCTIVGFINNNKY